MCTLYKHRSLPILVDILNGAINSNIIICNIGKNFDFCSAKLLVTKVPSLACIQFTCIHLGMYVTS